MRALRPLRGLQPGAAHPRPVHGVRKLGLHAKDFPGRVLFAQGYQGSRYSYGYPACPDLQGTGPLLDLLRGAEIGVHLSDSHQMDPEYTTSALVAWHPQARYFST